MIREDGTSTIQVGKIGPATFVTDELVDMSVEVNPTFCLIRVGANSMTFPAEHYTTLRDLLNYAQSVEGVLA